MVWALIIFCNDEAAAQRDNTHFSDTHSDPKPVDSSMLPFTSQRSDIPHFKVDASSFPSPELNRQEITFRPEAGFTASSPRIFQNDIPAQVRSKLIWHRLQNIDIETRLESFFYQQPQAQEPTPQPSDAKPNLDYQLSQASPNGKPSKRNMFISSLFGKRPNPFGSGLEFHNGIDLVGPKGTAIVATANGRVSPRKLSRGYGIHVLIDHGFGYETLYAHLSKSKVKANQFVKRGQIIGYLGSSGRSTGPHLHYTVFVNQEAVDPKPYLLN